MKTCKPAQTRFPLAWKAAASTASLLLMIVFSPAASHADGGATKIDFVGEELLTPIGPPGKIWMSGDVQHIRDLPLFGPVWGDITGTLFTSFNVNLNLTTGDGTGFGTFVFDVEWNGLSGTFEGRARAKYEGFVISGFGSGRGTGGFEGMKFQAHFFQVNGHTLLAGTILIPHGDDDDGKGGDDDDKNGKDKDDDDDEDDE